MKGKSNEKIFFAVMILAGFALGASFEELSSRCTSQDQSGCKELFALLKNDCVKNNKKESCEVATGMLLLSKDRNIRLQGVELVEKGCNLGSGSSCLVIADLYAEGKLVEKDIDKALKYG